MRYWSLEKEGVIENGELIYTAEQVQDYKAVRIHFSHNRGGLPRP